MCELSKHEKRRWVVTQFIFFFYSECHFIINASMRATLVILYRTTITFNACKTLSLSCLKQWWPPTHISRIFLLYLQTIKISHTRAKRCVIMTFKKVRLCLHQKNVESRQKLMDYRIFRQNFCNIRKMFHKAQCKFFLWLSV